MELFHAHHQWANRPADERFRTLADMHAATLAYATAAVEKDVPWNDLRVEAQGDELSVIGKAGTPAVLTHYAFGQLAARVGAPAGYLRSIPATLAAQNVNYGLKQRAPEGSASLLFHRNSRIILRAATSEKYSRIWNHEVIARLADLCESRGMVPAAPTFRQTGDDAPALYASDHDMFAFVMSADRVIPDPTGANLFRGIIVANSEVGDKALSVMGFYFRDICGNHIIWGAQQIAEIRLTHVGNIRGRWAEATARVRRYLDGSASFDTAKFQEMTVRIGNTKDEVLDALFGKKLATRGILAASYDAVKPEEDGDPRTVWGFAQGMTRHSQTLPFADERTAIDKAAGKLLDFKF